MLMNYVFTLDCVFLQVGLPKTQNQQTSMFYSHKCSLKLG